MKLIAAGRNLFAMVDDEDFFNLSRFSWHAQKMPNTVYARRKDKITGKYVLMHSELFPGIELDHEDHNGLNNQRCNLRPCTRGDNLRNRKGYGFSKYKGVSKNGNRWIARITINKKQIKVGSFESGIEAAWAYNNAAIASGNPFCYLNEL